MNYEKKIQLILWIALLCYIPLTLTMEPQGQQQQSKQTMLNNLLFNECAKSNPILSNVLYFIQQGADVNTHDANGVTPLHKTCVNNHFAIAQLLIENGADIEAKATSIEATPLHVACAANSVDIITLLLKKGANVNATTVDGDTSLIFAVIDNNIKFCELLLASGANPYLTTKYGVTALDIAYEEKKEGIILLFKKYGVVTMDEQQADRNMRAFLAELNEEKLQKEQKITTQQKKKQIKKIEPKEQKILSKKEIKRRKQRSETTTKSSPEVTAGDIKKPLADEPREIITTSPVVTTSTTSTSSTSTPITTGIAKPTTISTPLIQSKHAIKEEETSKNGYFILIDKKVNSRLLNQTIKDHIKQLKNWPHHGGDIKKLEGKYDMFRLRIVGYRIIF